MNPVTSLLCGLERTTAALFRYISQTSRKQETRSDTKTVRAPTQRSFDPRTVRLKNSPKMATAQLADVLMDRLPLVGSAVVVLAFTLIVQYLLKRDPLAAFPFAGEDLSSEQKRREAYLINPKSVYMEAYRNFRDNIFKITTATHKNVVVVPIKFLDELKRLPDDVVSFDAAIEDLMVTDYTNLISGDQTITHVVKANLTPALVRLNPILTEEVARAVRSEMPACPDWTDVNVYQKILRIVAIVSGRVFVGPELCHDEGYLDAAINYTVELFNARTAVTRIKPWLRPFRAPFLLEVRRLPAREETFNAVIQPIVAARREAERTDPSYVKPDDVLQWILDDKAKDVAKGAATEMTDRQIAKLQLSLSLAAIHTTSMMATNAFYDLAANPDVIAELREECSTVLAANGGVFTSPALQSLKKLDSCLKETLRLNPPGFSSFTRKVLKPFTLSNGHLIPAGVMIEVPSYPQSRDPEPYPEPETWDGLRFHRMREAGEDFNAKSAGRQGSAVDANAHNQFVSVSHRSLVFGYGRHACPGRFFAANEIKMIVARCLLQYDIKLPDGVTQRFPNFEFSGAIVPDPTKTLLFRETR
ncbi:hypothetical protein RB594_002433 [Gaeumannomyces avenae]